MAYILSSFRQERDNLLGQNRVKENEDVISSFLFDYKSCRIELVNVNSGGFIMLFSKIIKKKFDAVLGRYEGDPAITYPKIEDFPNLNRQYYPIQGDRQVQLEGYFYFKEAFNPDQFIIFDHGISAGHEAYLNEINMLAENGYTVYSYDHTGCVHTKGSGILGFAQGINDLDHVVSALLKDSTLQIQKVRLMGHSWGAYASMNVAALHPEVTHIVSLAGFLSARALNEQYIPKPFLKYSDEVMDRERQHNPKYADMNALDSLKKSDCALFYIQSKEDQKVKFELGYEPLYNAFHDRKNTQFVAVENHGHDPQRLPNEEFKQDLTTWKLILQFLE